VLQHNRLRWYGPVSGKTEKDWVRKYMDYEMSLYIEVGQRQIVDKDLKDYLIKLHTVIYSKLRI